MKISNVTIGIALVLSICSFVLALWPAVGDPPWEESSNNVAQGQSNVPGRSAQAKVCLQLLDDIGSLGFEEFRYAGATGDVLQGYWEAAGCDEYLAILAD